MVWASLRCDDVQCVKPLLTTLSNYGLRMVLTKTKTTGNDKAHKEVMAFIHRTTSLTGIDWLGVGFEIWSSEQFRYSRDYQAGSPFWRSQCSELYDVSGSCVGVQSRSEGLPGPMGHGHDVVRRIRTHFKAGGVHDTESSQSIFGGRS